ncbi:MAG: hypothetical protein ABL997_12700, partial [Planctomycetota bacterium]
MPPCATHSVDEAPGQTLDNDPLCLCREISVPHVARKNCRARQRHSWAELLRRVYLIDALTCPSCQGRQTLLAALHYRDFRVLWFGAVTSSIGTWMQEVALNWL